MEKFKLQWEMTSQALMTFLDAFDVIEMAKKIGIEKIILATEDSCIQRFEYTFDNFWKTVKSYLEQKYNITDVNSPKGVFRACVKHKLCTESEGDSLIDMADDRNSTTHRYDSAQIREILTHLKYYYQLMQNIMGKIEP